MLFSAIVSAALSSLQTHYYPQRIITEHTMGGTMKSEGIQLLFRG